VEKMRTDYAGTKSIFTITALVNNSGESSVSIKRTGLLRVYIGAANYVDLKFDMLNYEESAQVEAHGSKIAVFQSVVEGDLQPADRELLTRYWGQSVHCVLFVEDSLNRIKASNKIVFSEGIFQKLLIDRLSQEAGKEKYYTDLR
jgi:hypothetical protein